MRSVLLALLLSSTALATREDCQNIATQLPSEPEIVAYGRVNQDNPRLTRNYIQAIMRDYFDATENVTRLVMPFAITSYEAAYARFAVVVSNIPPFTWCVLANPFDRM